MTSAMTTWARAQRPRKDVGKSEYNMLKKIFWAFDAHWYVECPLSSSTDHKILVKRLPFVNIRNPTATDPAFSSPVDLKYHNTLQNWTMIRLSGYGNNTILQVKNDYSELCWSVQDGNYLTAQTANSGDQRQQFKYNLDTGVFTSVSTPSCIFAFHPVWYNDTNNQLAYGYIRLTNSVDSGGVPLKNQPWTHLARLYICHDKTACYIRRGALKHPNLGSIIGESLEQAAETFFADPDWPKLSMNTLVKDQNLSLMFVSPFQRLFYSGGLDLQFWGHWIPSMANLLIGNVSGAPRASSAKQRPMITAHGYLGTIIDYHHQKSDQFIAKPAFSMVDNPIAYAGKEGILFDTDGESYKGYYGWNGESAAIDRSTGTIHNNPCRIPSAFDTDVPSQEDSKNALTVQAELIGNENTSSPNQTLWRFRSLGLTKARYLSTKRMPETYVDSQGITRTTTEQACDSTYHCCWTEYTKDTKDDQDYQQWNWSVQTIDTYNGMRVARLNSTKGKYLTRVVVPHIDEAWFGTDGWAYKYGVGALPMDFYSSSLGTEYSQSVILLVDGMSDELYYRLLAYQYRVDCCMAQLPQALSSFSSILDSAKFQKGCRLGSADTNAGYWGPLTIDSKPTASADAYMTEYCKTRADKSNTTTYDPKCGCLVDLAHVSQFSTTVQEYVLTAQNVRCWGVNCANGYKWGGGDYRMLDTQCPAICAQVIDLSSYTYGQDIKQTMSCYLKEKENVAPISSTTETSTRTVTETQTSTNTALSSDTVIDVETNTDGSTYTETEFMTVTQTTTHTGSTTATTAPINPFPSTTSTSTATTTSTSTSILDTLLQYWWVGAIVVVLLLGIWWWRSGSSSSSSSQPMIVYAGTPNEYRSLVS
jgi:hypothetical protein